MKITIHRGADHIGGNCIEVEYNGNSILLDFGMPLDDNELPLVPASVDLSKISAAIISHPHNDHIGLVDVLPSHVPVYIGRRALRLVREVETWVKDAVKLANAKEYLPYKPFTAAGFVITPYPVEHAAFDSYALLVEAGGKRLFYTGDFREWIHCL